MQTPLKTKWCVITGGPSSGKTCLIDHLSVMGYRTLAEVARVHIDNQLSHGHTIVDIRGDEATLQSNILNLKITAENALPKDELVFLDRGLPDSLAYFDLYACDVAPVKEAMQNHSYKQIFFLEPLTYAKDHIRVESAQTAKELSERLYAAYCESGYDPIRVPIMPISERAQFVLNAIQLT